MCIRCSCMLLFCLHILTRFACFRLALGCLIAHTIRMHFCVHHMKNGRQFIIVGSVFVLSCTDFSSVLSIPSRRYIWDSISLSSQFFFINFGLSTFVSSLFFSFVCEIRPTDTQWNVYFGRCCNAINQKIMFIPTEYVYMFAQRKWSENWCDKSKTITFPKKKVCLLSCWTDFTKNVDHRK